MTPEEELAVAILLTAYLIFCVPGIGYLVDRGETDYGQCFGAGAVVHILFMIAALIFGSIYWALSILW